jgi:Tfp pilus assembly protein PilF
VQTPRRAWIGTIVIAVSVAGAVWLRAASVQVPPGQPASVQPAPAAAREDAWRANNVGVAYLEQYNHDAAAKSFRRALEIDPQLALARINLAIALFYLPDLPASMKEAQAAVAADAKAPQPHYILGLIAKSENRVDDAVAEFRQVLAIDTSDLGARVNLAQLLMQRREYDEAVSLLRPAVAAEPYHVTAKYNLGVALTRAGKSEEGQQVMAEFQKLREGGYGTTFSNNYLEQGRYAEAIASTGAEASLVDRATPDVRFVEAAKLPAAHGTLLGDVKTPQGQLLFDAIVGGVTLADVDRDGDLDLLDVSAGQVRLYLNDKGAFTDATAKAGLPGQADRNPAVAVVAGDYDNDERPDLLVLGTGRHVLLHQTADGRFEDVTVKAELPGTTGLFRSAAFVDVDHDGDLDIFLVGLTAGQAALPAGASAALPPARNVLWRNNGNGSFADVTSESGVGASPINGVAVAPTDFDSRRDVDLIVAADSQAPIVLKNMRDGTFRDVAADVGLTERGRYAAIAAGDVNKDGFTDLVFARHDGPILLALSDGRGRFTTSTPLPGAGPAFAAQLVDYDNDGLLDLVTLGPSGPIQVWRNAGGDWRNVSAAALPGAAPCASCAQSGSLAAGDLDGDGDTDLVVRTWDGARAVGTLTIQRNEGGNRHPSLSVKLTGRVSNRSAIGSKVELRAGSLRSRLETSSATPAIAPADLVFGLGPRPGADVVRVLWPAGILQAEVPGEPAPGAPAPGAPSRSPQPAARSLSLTELDRKPSSCPYLYTWNGERFEFITDFMGGGEMGYQHAPGIVNTPDPEEFTRIDGDRLRARDGRYELRVTNELEEALFIDRLQLVVVDHRSDVEVHPREGLVEPPFPSFELYGATDVRSPLRATDDRGRDVLERVRDLDRRFVDDLPLERIRGYAKRHELTLDLGSRPEAGTLLLLTGWTDYAFSSDNIAAHQAGLALEPPYLQVKDASGQWRTVVKEIGIPVGRPQTVVVDLGGRFLSASREVRIVTSMRIYWDQIRVATRDVATASAAPRLTRLDPLVANLRWRGFSAEVSPDGKEPFGYDYDRVSATSPWKTMPGRYTREGDVRELLHDVDDLFVVSRPGDEVALAFDARALPPLAAGWTRTFLLHSVGYSKEMDRNSASPDAAWPLPFRTMTRYPYAAPESYPDTPRHREYLERWNTRFVRRAVPPIELASPNP